MSQKDLIMALADKMRQESVANFQASDEYRDVLEYAVQAHADEVEALKADVQTLLSHIDTFMRVSNDPAIYSLAKVVTERFAARAAQEDV